MNGETPLVHDGTSYSITITMATGPTSSGGNDFESESVLKIISFSSDDVGDYSCRVLYDAPILNDLSANIASLTILGWLI